MSEEIRAGFYKDKYGEWQKERRHNGDRRNVGEGSHSDHEKRGHFRRQVDREMYECDRQDIEDALCDFAEEHDGHL